MSEAFYIGCLTNHSQSHIDSRTADFIMYLSTQALHALYIIVAHANYCTSIDLQMEEQAPEHCQVYHKIWIEISPCLLA